MTMIQVSDLSLTYPGTRNPAVDGISFEVGQGEIFGFLSDPAAPARAQPSASSAVSCSTGRVP